MRIVALAVRGRVPPSGGGRRPRILGADWQKHVAPSWASERARTSGIKEAAHRAVERVAHARPGGGVVVAGAGQPTHKPSGLARRRRHRVELQGVTLLWLCFCVGRWLERAASSFMSLHYVAQQAFRDDHRPPQEAQICPILDQIRSKSSHV